MTKVEASSNTKKPKDRYKIGSNMKIDWQHELPTQLRALLGAEYILVYLKYASLHFGENISCGYIPFPVRIKPQYHYFDHRESDVIELKSKWQESIAGDLYGIVATLLDPKDEAQTYTEYSSNIAVYGPVNKIVGLGENRDEVVVVRGQEDELRCFFPKNAVLPDTITIKKKTLEVIGFGLASGKWLYLFSAGEGGTTLRLHETLSPEEMCQHQDYIAMEKQLQILEVFE